MTLNQFVGIYDFSYTSVLKYSNFALLMNFESFSNDPWSMGLKSVIN